MTFDLTESASPIFLTLIKFVTDIMEFLHTSTYTTVESSYIPLFDIIFKVYTYLPCPFYMKWNVSSYTHFQTDPIVTNKWNQREIQTIKIVLLERSHLFLRENEELTWYTIDGKNRNLGCISHKNWGKLRIFYFCQLKVCKNFQFF